MSNMLAATLVISGSRPLLLNRFGSDAIPLSKKERTGVAGNDPQEWKRHVCWNDRRQLFLDGPVVFAAIRDGGRFTKRGRGTLQLAIMAALQVTDDIILIDRFLPTGDPPMDPSAAVYIDVRGVRMQARGSWNVRYRLAVSKGWQATAHLLWDKTIVSRVELHSACIDAGKYAGIGDGRKIGFGRFEVSRFEVEDAEETTAS